MLHFSRKTEYALIAIEHMVKKAKEGESLASAREISQTYHIPLPITAKVLQQLGGRGLIKSVQGTKGGYVLAKQPQDITLAMVVEIFEGPLAMTECFREEKITCPQWDGCTIKSPLYELNHKIHQLLTHTTVADLRGANP